MMTPEKTKPYKGTVKVYEWKCPKITGTFTRMTLTHIFVNTKKGLKKIALKNILFIEPWQVGAIVTVKKLPKRVLLAKLKGTVYIHGDRVFVQSKNGDLVWANIHNCEMNLDEK